MIDVKAVRPTRLTDLGDDELFIPIGGGEHFLVGHLNNFRLTVALDSDPPFSASFPDNRNRLGGIAAKGIGFEVDVSSGHNIRTHVDANPGDLIMDGDRLAVLAVDGHERFPVWLVGDPKKDVMGGIAFGAWQIVRHDNGEKLVLFVKGGQTN
jgi:hypothetical protein